MSQRPETNNSTPKPSLSPFYSPHLDYCTCGWPLFRDGTCSNGECPDGGGIDYDDGGGIDYDDEED